VRARAKGYRGVSSKTCKGIYKSFVNAARCALWNRETPGRYLMSAEDLTIQAGIALQQDLALVSLLGITHVERNGHHYVDGMAALPEGRAAALPRRAPRPLRAQPRRGAREDPQRRARDRLALGAGSSLSRSRERAGVRASASQAVAAPDWGIHANHEDAMSSVTPSSAANATLGQRFAAAFAYYLPSLLVILALLVLWQVLVSFARHQGIHPADAARGAARALQPELQVDGEPARHALRRARRLRPLRRARACCSRSSSSGTICCCAP
jgi:hypothetical protein